MGLRGWGGLVQPEDTDRVIAIFPRDSLVKLLVEEAMHPGEEIGWDWVLGLL